MSVAYMPLIDHRGAFSHKRMHLQPVVSIQNYLLSFREVSRLILLFYLNNRMD